MCDSCNCSCHLAVAGLWVNQIDIQFDTVNADVLCRATLWHSEQPIGGSTRKKENAVKRPTEAENPAHQMRMCVHCLR